MTSFSLFQTVEVPDQAIQDLPTAFLHNESQPISAKLPHVHILPRLWLMCTINNMTRKETQTRYIQYFDQSLRKLPASRPRDYVYLDRPSTLKIAANRMADELLSKLLPEAVGPFRITAVTSRKIKISDDGKLNVISIYRATPAPRTKNAPQLITSIHEAQSDNSPPDPAPKTTRNKTHPATKHAQPTWEAADNSDMYVTDHIARYINTKTPLLQIYIGWGHDQTVKQHTRAPHQVLLTPDPSKWHNA